MTHDEPRTAQDEPEVRHDLIAHIRQQIASGRYATEKRLELAVKRMLDSGDLERTT